MKKHWLFTTLIAVVLCVVCITLFSTEAEAANISDLTFKLNSGGWSYNVSDCSELASGDLQIPETYNGKPVTGIGGSAFYGCSSLTSITIPDSVTSIGSRAFRGCSNLTNVAIGNSVTSIGEYAFYECSALKSITIPDGVTSIGDFGFHGCSGLKSVTIPNSVTSIGNSAFRGCEGLTSITIPTSVTSIGDCAFRGCKGLTSIIVPDGVTKIGQWAFSYCSNLTDITFPDSLTYIDYMLLRGCTSLTSITIPNSVTSIGFEAFQYCRKLNDVYYSGSEEKWKKIRIRGGNEDLECATIHYNHVHNYTLIPAVDVPPTCTKEGYTEYTCAYGEKYRTNYVPVLEHTKGTDMTLVVPTCGTDGYTKFTCSSCSRVIITFTVAKLGHDFKGKTEVIAPTCTEDGYTKIQCTRCTETKRLNYVSALNHSMIHEAGVAATCTKDGHTVGTICSRCGFLGTATKIDKNGHNYADATCTKAKTCKVCGATSGKKLGHTYTNDCDTSCNRCGATRSITHNYKTTTTKATLSKDGSIVKKCTGCGKVTSTTTIKFVKTVKLSTTSYIYDGTTKKPIVTVKDSAGKTLKKGTDYDVTYASGRKNAGTYKVTIKFKGNYSGTKTLTFKIGLATPTVKTAAVSNGIKVSWNKISGAKTYTIYRSTYSNGKWSTWKAVKTGITGTTYTDKTVKSGTTVKYTVRAVNGSVLSAYKGSSSVKFLTAPAVKATTTTGGVKVTWNKINGAKTYAVYRSTYSGGKWSSWKAVKTGVTGTSYTDKTVKSGTTVKYTVRAVNGSVLSAYKESSSVKYVSQHTVTVAKTTSGIKVSWTKVSGATGYYVYRRAYVNGKWGAWEKIKTTTALNCTDKTAKKGVSYQYSVQAYTSNKNSNSIKI